MHIRRMIYACLFAIAVVVLGTSSTESAVRGLIIEEDGNEIVWVWDGVTAGEVELLEGGTSGTLEIFWLANDSSRFQPSGVGDSVKIEVSDSSLVAIAKLTTWTFTLSSIDEHGHVDMVLTQYIAGLDDYTSPDIKVHIEHDHAEAEGLVISDGDSTLVTIWNGIVTGDLKVRETDSTEVLEVFFLDLDSVPFQPEIEEGFALADSVDNESIAALTNVGDWTFRIHGDSSATTELVLNIWHIDHIDYSSLPIDIIVTSCCVGMRGDANGNGPLNVLDLNYLVAYFFAGGTPPPCAAEANANGNAGINVLDLNYLVSYFFAGGPAPVACP